MALLRGQRQREKPGPRTTSPKKLARGQCDGVRTFTPCPHTAVSEIPSAAQLPTAKLLQSPTSQSQRMTSQIPATTTGSVLSDLGTGYSDPDSSPCLLASVNPPSSAGLRLDATAASRTILCFLYHRNVLSGDLTSLPEGRCSILFFFVSLILAQGLAHDISK